MFRKLAFIVASLVASLASAQQTFIVDSDGTAIGFTLELDGSVTPHMNVTVVKPGPPAPGPTPQPIDAGQVICLRPWSSTLDESDADLTIRESLDAVQSEIPYISVLPGTFGQGMKLHPALEHYRKLQPDPDRAYCFHVAETAGGPRIIHEGPLDADMVLGWLDVPTVDFSTVFRDEVPSEDDWLDIDFEDFAPALSGALDEDLTRRELASATNVISLPGFRPIPRSEWSAWTARFPVERLARSIHHITDQVMGSCVGHAACNGMEAATYMQAGDLYFRILSPQSMYQRIGRSPNSGAYVGDAAEELFERGILPADGERDINGDAYPHTHHVHGNFYTKPPSGWEATAEAWKAKVYRVTDDESAFRVLMDCRLRTQFGRSRHSISGFAVTSSKKWAYENSWGTNWGDLGKSVGYDSRFYDSWTYHPVLRNEIVILVADREPVRREKPEPTDQSNAAVEECTTVA